MNNKPKLTPAQKWERATLADNFIFCKVMTANPDLCKELLEMLLGIEIDRIEQPLAEHSLKSDYNSKGIRFDVYVKDGTGRCFDIEVQTTSRKSLARRARYYQGMMDIDSLERGTDYGDLKDGYVIFLCLDDPFGWGLPVYTFSNICKENREIFLNDGAHKIFYNAAKHAIMPNETLKSFFRFLAGTADGSALSGRLAAMVGHAKTNAQWRQQFMTWEQEMKEQVKERAEVLALELAEERAEEMAQERAEKMAQERAEELAAQKDIETARKLLDEAISMETIARCTGLPLAQVERLRQEASAVEA
ncbi:MAG: Rpn family recombination-promoting nuclease/putative transposase [Treponemataceae bacterium]|nr:Rpn family recombination-promoting nuclease/putative transposase [Treponemataceae bacterium]